MEKLLKVRVFLATRNFVDTVSPSRLKCESIASFVCTRRIVSDQVIVEVEERVIE